VEGANEVTEQLRQLEIADGVQEYGDKMRGGSAGQLVERRHGYLNLRVLIVHNDDILCLRLGYECWGKISIYQYFAADNKVPICLTCPFE
jgi:hypothetical protein